MFERFTESARQVLVKSQEAARDLQHAYIGTEHLLVALLLVEEGMAAKVMRNIGLSPTSLRASITKLCGTGEVPVVGQIPFTPGAKGVLDSAMREALRLGHNYVRTEHLLLALVREPESMVARILTNLDIYYADVANSVMLKLTGVGSLVDPAPKTAPDMPPKSGHVMVQVEDGSGKGFLHVSGTSEGEYAFQRTFPSMPWTVVSNLAPLFFIGGNSLRVTSVFYHPDGLTEIGVTAEELDQTQSWFNLITKDGYTLVSLLS